MARFHRPDKKIKQLRLQQVDLFEDCFSVQQGWVSSGLSQSRLEQAASADEARTACETYLATLEKDGWKRIVVESPPTKVGDRRRYTFNEAFFEIEIKSPNQFETSTGWIGKPANGGNVFNGADPTHTIWWAESVIAERISKGYELDAPKKKKSAKKKSAKKKLAKKKTAPVKERAKARRPARRSANRRNRRS